MSGEITRVRDGKKSQVRPSFEHHAPTNGTWANDQVTSEIIESSRNVQEEMLAELKKLNALLYCHNFTDLPRVLRGLRRDFATERKARK